ncbi:ABC transporter permease subunit [Paraneptunicella aestuarii]|uniref:ABC transporter permease subunit n=1 Tax=Paraneptunicella aestuarii TaxID=2831148 RepID=UPI001E5BDFCB|nr:ABC transporter permease subunit [Paraneptunicella aestuarii]UAA37792.1 ABC transporter permease subunit [Paraneptunicella aestuarii]
MLKTSLYQEELHPSPLQQTWLEFSKSHVAFFGLCCFMFFVFLMLIGPYIVPYTPQTQHTEALLIPPAWAPNGGIDFMLGTDALGRDILTRVIYGSRVTFGISLFLVMISLIVGVVIGALAGMNRGMQSSMLNHLLDSIMAIPTLLIAIIIVAILGPGLVNSMWAITLALIPQFIHYTRDAVKKELDKPYVTASRLDGASRMHIFIHSVFPNIIQMLVVQGTHALSTAILDISALGFLSLGVQAPKAELGAMLSEGLDIAYIAPWSIAAPGAAIFLMIVSINLVGDGLRTALHNRLLH